MSPCFPSSGITTNAGTAGGYPDRLAGTEIPLTARVFQVADAYDALTSERPYRQKLSPAAALDLIRTEADDGRFDLAIVRVFVDGMAVSAQIPHPLLIRRPSGERGHILATPDHLP